MPGTHVTTTVQKFIVVVTAGYAVCYDCTEIYREDDDEEEEESGSKNVF